MRKWQRNNIEGPFNYSLTPYFPLELLIVIFVITITVINILPAFSRRAEQARVLAGVAESLLVFQREMHLHHALIGEWPDEGLPTHVLKESPDYDYVVEKYKLRREHGQIIFTLDRGQLKGKNFVITPNVVHEDSLGPVYWKVAYENNEGVSPQNKSKKSDLTSMYVIRQLQ